MSPNEPKPATPEAQALLRVADRDWKTIEVTGHYFHESATNCTNSHEDSKEIRANSCNSWQEKVCAGVSGVGPERLPIEITLTDADTIAEMMEHVHAWVERQIYA